jgi:hypothetical protein
MGNVTVAWGKLPWQAQVFTLLLAFSLLRYNGLILERFWMYTYTAMQ